MFDRPLRVALDARCLDGDRLRGIGRATSEFVRRTSASGAVEWQLVSNRPGRRGHLWEQYSLPRAAVSGEADLLHAPAGAAPWWQPVPTVVTVHDTIPWQSEEGGRWKPGFYRDRLLPSAYHRAAALITINHNSRRDILARWPALKPSLHVVPIGVDERYLDAEPDAAPIVIGERTVSGPYLLYVGGAEPRKRLMWALQAWSSGRTQATMIVCGVEASAHALFRARVPEPLQDRLIFAPFINQDDMPRLYMRAVAALYPSLFEGFGLPVIEAHAVGTRVLFSDLGGLSELKGPAAVVLPPDDMAAWVRTIDLLVQSHPTTYGPDRIARAWASQYSWDAHTERALRIYHEVAAQSVPRDRDHHVSQGATS